MSVATQDQFTESITDYKVTINRRTKSNRPSQNSVEQGSYFVLKFSQNWKINDGRKECIAIDWLVDQDLPRLLCQINDNELTVKNGFKMDIQNQDNPAYTFAILRMQNPSQEGAAHIDCQINNQMNQIVDKCDYQFSMYFIKNPNSTIEQQQTQENQPQSATTEKTQPQQQQKQQSDEELCQQQHGKFCQKCNDSLCTHCQDSYYMNLENICVEQCPDGSYQNSTLMTCVACNNKCTTCNEIECLTCQDNRINPPNCECQQGFYEDNQLIKCIECPHQCTSCSNKDQCQSCKGNRDLIVETGQCQCPNGTYENNTLNCPKCHFTCDICQNNKPDGCLQCKPNRDLPYCSCIKGFFDDGIDENCQLCNFKCSVCEFSTTNCLACVSNRVNPPSCDCPANFEDKGEQGCVEMVCKGNRENYPNCTCPRGFEEVEGYEDCQKMNHQEQLNKFGVEWEAGIDYTIKNDSNETLILRELSQNPNGQFIERSLKIKVFFEREFSRAPTVLLMHTSLHIESDFPSSYKTELVRIQRDYFIYQVTVGPLTKLFKLSVEYLAITDRSFQVQYINANNLANPSQVFEENESEMKVIGQSYTSTISFDQPLDDFPSVAVFLLGLTNKDSALEATLDILETAKDQVKVRIFFSNGTVTNAYFALIVFPNDQGKVLKKSLKNLEQVNEIQTFQYQIPIPQTYQNIFIVQGLSGINANLSYPFKVELRKFNIEGNNYTHDVNIHNNSIISFLKWQYIIYDLPTCVILYSECDFKGTQIEICDDIKTFDHFNEFEGESVKSIYVPKGMKITVYEHENHSGRKVDFTSSQMCLEKFDWKQDKSAQHQTYTFSQDIQMEKKKA